MENEILKQVSGFKSKYQITLALIIWSMSFLVHIPMTGFPFFLKRPVILCRQKSSLTNQTNEFELCVDYTPTTCNFDTHEYKIDKEKSIDSLATSLDLFCEDDIYLTLYPSFFFIGCMIGASIFSSFADKKGRLPVFKILSIVTIVSTSSFLFVSSKYLIIVVAIFSGISANFVNFAQVLSCEFFTSDYSSLVMSITNGMYPLTGVLVIAFFYYFNSWKLMFSILTVMSFFVCFLVYSYTVESPRWLNSQNRLEERVEVLKKIGMYDESKEKLEEALLKGSQENQPIQPKKFNFSEVVKNVEIRKNLIYISIIICLLFQIFYSLIYNLENSKLGEFYFNALLIYGGESLAQFVSFYFADTHGRKKSMQWFFFICGFSYITSALVTSQSISNFFVFIAAFTIASAINISFIYTPEVFPTSIRSTCCSITYISGRVSCMICPLLYKVVQTPLYYGSLSLINGCILFNLMETLGRKLNDHVEVEEKKN